MSSFLLLNFCLDLLFKLAKFGDLTHWLSSLDSKTLLLLIWKILFVVFVLGDQELAGEQESQDTPFEQGKPQYSGHEALKLLFAKLMPFFGFCSHVWLIFKQVEFELPCYAMLLLNSMLFSTCYHSTQLIMFM